MNYRQKYFKYKKKYLKLLESGYQKNGKYYDVYKTIDGNFMSYYRDSGLDKYQITDDLRKPNRSKILVIDSIKVFDFFTQKYGVVHDDAVYIKWNKVSNDYKGFYLNQENKNLFFERHDHIIFKFRRLKSWWSNEYNFVGILIFDQ